MRQDTLRVVLHDGDIFYHLPYAHGFRMMNAPYAFIPWESPLGEELHARMLDAAISRLMRRDAE